jgi:hypothetical protein
VKLASVALAAALVFAALPAGAKGLGFNVHQSSTIGLDATKDAGLKWVRVDFNWVDAEPSQQGQYDWARFDTLIDAAVAKNLKVLAVIGYSPAWASQGDTKGDGSTNDVPQTGKFAPFVTAAVNRYKNRVTHWEVWNEPNLGQFFEGTPNDYIQRVLVPGADAVHAACSACKVMGPGLASVGGQYAVWMDAVLGAAKDKIDIVSGHIYAAFPTPGGGAGTTSDSFFNKLESHRVVKLGNGIVVYEGPLSYKEVMDKHGVTKPFWLTETGYEATRGNASEEQAQLVLYRQVIEQMLARSWWDATIFYEAFDEPPAPYRWGAVVHDESVPKKYVPKPVHGFLAKVTSSQPAFGGTKTDCDDGLDNDLDGQIDHPSDTTCTSLASASEGVTILPDGGSSGGSTPSGSSSSSSSSGSDESSSGAAGEGATDAHAGDEGCATTASDPRSGFAAIVAAALALAALRRGRRTSRGAAR